MNNKTIRLLCLFLTFASLFSMLIACKDKDNTGASQNTAAANNGDEYAAYINEIGIKNYDGRDFVIATQNTDTASFFTLHPDEKGYMGYSVSDAMYSRDLKMEEAYGVHITYRLFGENDNGIELATMLGNTELLGTHTCDMITSNLSSSIITLQNQSSLYDIGDLPVVNSNMPWWSSYFWEGVSYNDSLYFVAGQAAGGGFFATPYVMICNLQLAQDVYMQDGETTLDIFSMIENGEWTLENFEYIISDYTTDLNSDSEISVYQDRMAYAHCRSDVTALCHYVAAGMKLSTVDSDGNIDVLLGADAENMVERLGNAFDGIKDNFDEKAYFQDKPSQQMVAFKNNRALFFGNSMSYVDEITDMEANYAIIPCPKADTKQKDYFSGINTWTPGYIAFPGLCGDGDAEFVGYTAELLGYWSSVYVKPEVYDKVLCLRLAKDPRQMRIMDTIYDNLYVDLNYVKDFAKSASLIANCIMDTNQSFVGGRDSANLILPYEIDKFIRDSQKD